MYPRFQGILIRRKSKAGRYTKVSKPAFAEKEMSPAKQQVISLLDTLPDDCTLEDIQYHLYVITKLKKSIACADVEGTLSHAEVERRLSKWLAK